MHKTMHLSMSAALLALALSGTAWAQQPPPQVPNMSFFVASGFGKGGDLGGIDGADARCQTLAMSVGAATGSGGPISAPPRAPLSPRSMPAIASARARGRTSKAFIAENDDDLHGPGNKLNQQTALTERGAMIAGDAQLA
jgi:hypothetical protein